MAIKFKQAYDIKPDAGDDLDDENYLPLEKDAGAGSDSWGMKFKQFVVYLTTKFYRQQDVDAKIAAAVGTGSNDLALHDVDENAHTNILTPIKNAIATLFSIVDVPPASGAPDTLSFVIANNTTVGNVGLWLDTEMTNWLYKLGNSDAPTGDGNIGTINVSTLDLGQYGVPLPLYGWYKNTDMSETWYQVKPPPELSDGETVPGLVVQATQTAVSPEAITDLAVTRTVGSETSSLDITFSAAVAGTSAIANYLVRDTITNIIHIADITPDITTALPGLPSDTQYSLQVEVSDVNGLVNTSNIEVIRTSANDGGVIGIKAVSVRTSDNTTGYYEEENAGVTDLTVTLERTGGTDGAVSVLYRQVDRTALTGTNFTKTVENGTANKASWADGVSTDVDVDIALLDVNMTTNLCFEFQIIKDSEVDCSVDVNAYDWGRGNSVLCYINGSAAATTGYQQETTGDNLLVLPFTDAVYTNVVEGTDSWTFVAAADPGMTESGLETVPASWGIPTGATKTAVATGASETSVELPAVFNTTGVHYCWVRMYHPSGGSSDALHLDIDDTGSELYDVWADNTANNGINPRWKWVNVDSDSNILQKTIASVGAYSVKHHKWENTHRIDKVLFTTSSTYDPTGVGTAATRGGVPSIDDAWGPTASTYSAGAAVVDDSSNPTYPTIPDIAALIPGTLVPLDDADNVSSQQATFRAIFTGASGLVNPVFVVENNSTKATISGVSSVEGVNNNEAVFTASQNFTAGETYDIFLTASEITDENGVVSYVDQSSVGDWQITIADPATDLIWEETWSSFTAPYQITGTDNTVNTDLNDLWYMNTSAPPAGDQYTIQGVLENYLRVVDDPGGSVARGNVLELLLPGNMQRQYPVMTCFARFDVDNTNIPSPNANSDGDVSDVAPNSTDLKWNLTGGPPDLTAFADRETLRTATTQKAYDEIYFAYELRLDPNWYFNFAQKLPGVCTGTVLQASHTATAVSDGMYAADGFYMQIYDTVAWGSNPSGALTHYLYDADNIQQTYFLYRDGVLPVSNSKWDYNYVSARADYDRVYTMPRDTWVTIECRYAMNTAPAVLDAGFYADAVVESTYSDNGAIADGCSRDGEMEIWVTDPRPVSLDPYLGGTGGIPVKMLKIDNIMWRWHQAFKFDKVRMTVSTNKPHAERPNNPVDQHMYIDNVRVSENPITHT